MGVQRELPGKLILDRLADESGLAIAIVDRSSVEISVSNNNSICRSLNPNGEFSADCSRYCGRALGDASNAGETIAYTCHAGLECRATAMVSGDEAVVAIIGRTFTRADDYRKATERAMGGDWHQFAPSDFFENILLTGSSAVIDKTAAQLTKLAAIIESPAEESEPINKPKSAFETPADEISRRARELNQANPAEPAFPDLPPTAGRVTEIEAWHSFFGSLLDQHYKPACDAILEFLAEQYNFTSLVWLERRDHRFEDLSVFGDLQNHRIRLGVATDDPRLLSAAAAEMPLELGEKTTDAESSGGRSMYLFPVPVGSDIPSALAVLDHIGDEETKHQIARFCHSVAPQMEILRLRDEVAQRDSLALAVRKFSDSLKTIDSDDFWMQLTLNSAELLQSERASLLVMDEKSGLLEIKAAVGVTSDISGESAPGGRVSQIVFEKGKAAIVADVSVSGLQPAPDDRRYKTDSFISSPVFLGERNIAVINFTDKANGANFDKHDLDLIQAISPQIAVAIDRAGLKEQAGEFRQLSVTDALTGLLNRRYIEERLTEEVKRSNRHGYPMSFLMLDVDHFKSYNDQFGHPAGDEALKLVANLLKETLRGADVAARFGGEEFSILLPQTTDDEAAAIAERIRGNIANANFPHRSVTVSIGVASCSSELCSVKVLVSAADQALYDAKRRGRNRVRLFADMETEDGEN